jgi:hypothetical protein
MSETASNTFEIAISTNTGDAFLTALSSVFNSAEWASDARHSIDQTWQVVSSSSESVTLGLIETADGEAGPKIYFESQASPNSLFVRYDPNGIAEAGVYSPSSSVSPLVNFTGSNAVPAGITRMYVVQYTDALMIHFDAGTHFKYMIHTGIVMAPDNASDPDIYIDGSGVLVGTPYVSAAAATSSILTIGATINTTGQQSYVRIGETQWGQARAVANYTSTATEVADVNGRVRLVPALMRAITNINGSTFVLGTTQAAAVSGELGRTRYLRFYKQNPTHRSVLPSRDTDSSQAWLAWNYGPASSPLAHNVLGLWTKEDPIMIS